MEPETLIHLPGARRDARVGLLWPAGAAVCGHALAVAQVVSRVRLRCARVTASRSGEGTRGISTWRAHAAGSLGAGARGV
eukprot:2476845-Prymnesium_polylepis.1